MSVAIASALEELAKEAEQKHKKNKDAVIESYYIWNFIAKVADNRKDLAKAAMKEVLPQKDKFSVETPGFYVERQTDKWKEFDVEKFVELLVEKYNISKPELRALVVQARIKPKQRTTTSVERNLDG